MESVWKWWFRFLMTIIIGLVIGILALVGLTVPRVWDLLDDFGQASGSIERTARSIDTLADKASQAIDDEILSN